MKKFMFWCQKVLPLVYDDSLSYYETLCKLTAKINELIDFINGGITDWIKEHISEILIEAMYDEETRTITFNYELVGGDTHVYSAETETMEIK